MLTYRTFRNTDPPALAALWRSCAGVPGLRQSVSSDLLEQLVFAKLYFDYGGLMLACDDGRPMGFAHAGFGPNANGNSISTDSGVTSIVLVRPEIHHEEAIAGLLDRCEQYLRHRGAKVLYGGGAEPLDPFYLGLYGGSELPGVLDADASVRRAYAARGYREVERTVLLRRDLTRFEAHTDRAHLQARRQMSLEVALDAPTETWWEACTLGAFDLTRFELQPRSGGGPVATALFRSMEPSGTTSVSRSIGLVRLQVSQPHRRHGLAVFLLSEAFRHFLRVGVVSVEIQTRETDTAALAVFRRLGFEDVGRGGVWRKDE